MAIFVSNHIVVSRKLKIINHFFMIRGQNNAIFSTILSKSNAKALQSYTNCGT